jgi:glycerol kinase
MADDSLILAIDEGTSSAKCLLVDTRGRVVARGSAPLGETHPQPGWVEQDPGEIWDCVRAAVRDVFKAHDPKKVVAVGLSVQRESVVMWDRVTRQALSPVLSWQDQRTAAVCEGMRTPLIDRMVRAKSGLPLDPMFSALKAMAILDAADPQRTRAKAGDMCIGTIDSWLLSRFTTDDVIEVGMASRTQMLNVLNADWDDELLSFFRIPRAALPRVVSSVGPFPSVKGLDPLPDGVPVFAAMGDSHSALFAHGAYTPGAVKATYGTGSSIMGLVAEPGELDPGLCLTIAWGLDKPAFAAEGNIRACGQTLRWLAGVLGMTPQELADLGAGADAQGVSLVPGFTGLGAPWWDRTAVGLITGLTLGVGRKELARAALDSMVHQVADVIDAVNRSGAPLAELYADGGPTRNDALMRMQADLLGRPVIRANDAELSALGVAHMAGLKAGVWSWDDLKALPRSHDTFTPALPPDARSKARDEWLRAVARAR